MVSGPAGEIVHSNRPLRINSANCRNFYIAGSSNARENPVLSFGEHESTMFMLRHYKQQDQPAIICDQDVVQLVLQTPMRYLHCGEVRPLLGFDSSSK